MAYEAVALFLSRMEAVEGHAQAGARHAGRSPDDFRERVQVLALLHHARAGTCKPGGIRDISVCA